MKKIIWTVVVTVLVLMLIPLLVLASGAFNIAATTTPGSLEKSLASLAVNRSLAMRAPDKANPYADNPQAISTGLNHYAAMCVRCHGGPDVERSEFAQGLNPSAPQLTDVADEYSDGDLFWITKHGIRMTGMPAFGATHNDATIWKIAAFLKRLPSLSPEQKQQLADQGGGGGHSHGGEDAHADGHDERQQHEGSGSSDTGHEDHDHGH